GDSLPAGGRPLGPLGARDAAPAAAAAIALPGHALPRDRIRRRPAAGAHPLQRHPPMTHPGLQAERTRLAWRRTTLSATLALRLAGPRGVAGGGRPLALVAIPVMARLWLVFLAIAHRRITTIGPRSAGTAPAGVALLAAALAVIGILLVR